MADSLRVGSLEAATYAIRQYYAAHKKLPASMFAANVQPGDQTDPQTGLPYEYRVADSRHFELCATFQTDQSKTPKQASYDYRQQGLPFWRHTAGRQCFSLAAKDAGG